MVNAYGCNDENYRVPTVLYQEDIDEDKQDKQPNDLKDVFDQLLEYPTISSCENHGDTPTGL